MRFSSSATGARFRAAYADSFWLDARVLACLSARVINGASPAAFKAISEAGYRQELLNGSEAVVDRVSPGCTRR